MTRLRSCSKCLAIGTGLGLWTLWLAVSLFAGVPNIGAAEQTVNGAAAELKAFTDRVAAYLGLQKRLEAAT